MLPRVETVRIAPPLFDAGDRQAASGRAATRRARGSGRGQGLYALRRGRALRPTADRSARRAGCIRAVLDGCRRVRSRTARPAAPASATETVGAPPSRSARVSSTRSAASDVAKSCADRPIRRSGCGRPSAARIGRFSQGPVSTDWAARYRRSTRPAPADRRAAERASSGPQIAEPGMACRKRGRRISGGREQSREQRRASRVRGNWRDGPAKRRAQASQASSPSASPASPRPKCIRVGRGQHLGGGDGGFDEVRQTLILRSSAGRVSEFARRVQALDQRRARHRLVGIVGPERHLDGDDAGAAPHRGQGVGFRPRRAYLRSSRRAASSRSAGRPSPRVVRADASAAPADRPARKPRVDQPPAGSAAEVAGGVSNERLACGIVDLDVPAPQLCGVTRRARSRSGVTRAAVRLGRRAGLRAAPERSRQGFLVRGGAVGARDVIERGGTRAATSPHWSRRGASARPPACAAPDRRLGCRANPARRRASTAQGRPAARAGRTGDATASSLSQLVGSISRSRPGSTTAPLRQACDGDQQRARRRLRAGRSGGDHRRRGRWPPASARPGRGSPGCAVRWRRSGRARPASRATPCRRCRGR